MEPVPAWADLQGVLKVRLAVFEGPLDLLLHLIRSQRIDIYDIPIAEITAQYLEYLDVMRDLNLDVASEFLVMAATLAHIKSRMLLPVHEKDEEEEDPRAELVHQLLEYQRYKEASMGLRERLEQRALLHGRPADGERQREEIFMDVSLFELLRVFREVISTAAEGPALTVAPDRFAVVDKMGQIADLLATRETVGFRELFPPGAERGEIIAAFLAVLELVRMRIVRLAQAEFGGEITLGRGAEHGSAND
jgi:segregation and condensation protein A